ncbi:hypothetical protein HGM15179_003758 [Zosterops borbonicus]|uniref:Uncharacterized protein n=1 Tax=Zosterops borbonicus TaxID=364589 RepID=A0A8K1LRJ8_9PASS|nr:hypothetical protein HGM15179_003758 [Zosterops borbonicus]
MRPVLLNEHRNGLKKRMIAKQRKTEGKQSPLDTYHLMEAMLGLCSEILGNATCAILPSKRCVSLVTLDMFFAFNLEPLPEYHGKERAVAPSWQKTQVFCSGLVHLTIKIAPLGWCKDLLDGKFHMASTPLCGTTPEMVQKQGCDKFTSSDLMIFRVIADDDDDNTLLFPSATFRALQQHLLVKACKPSKVG